MEPAGPIQRLSVEEAVRLALEQNLNIQVERLNPQISDLGVAQARAAWTPNFFTTAQTQSIKDPPDSFLSGATRSLTTDLFSTNVGLRQQLPWGASVEAGWVSSRRSTNNIFSDFNPTLRSNLDFEYVQPLLRNFKIDNARQQLLISRKNREISDLGVRQTIAATERNVKNAYWDLRAAIAAVEVARQSLALANELLRNNRTRVEVGTMAPIDIVEAEAEVAQREEAAIVAEAAITQAEDRLRALIFDPATPQFWSMKIEPTSTFAFEPRPVDLEAAVRSALDKRTDLQESRKNLETSDINIKYFRNQSLPEVNVQANYGLRGVGGTQFARFSGFPGGELDQRPIVGHRGFGSVLGDLLANDFPNWTLMLNVGYPIGTSSAETSLARAKLEYTQSRTQLRNLELQIATQVRELGRNVMTNAKRVDATRASRQLAQRRLEAEQKKFGVGMSTSFLVFQAQRDLAESRNRELRAELDYAKSLVDFETVQVAPVGGGGGSVMVAGAGVSGGPSLPVQTGPPGFGTSPSTQGTRR